MTTLVLGASGATGRLLVQQLLDRGQNVKVVVRRPDKVADKWSNARALAIVRGNVLALKKSDLQELVRDCDSVASCLGHNMTFKGMFGPPYRLVADTARRVCRAIIANPSETAVKFVLMNTVGNSNRDLQEPVSFAQRCVLGLLRLTVAPHVDNEKAADFLRTEVGQQNPWIDWTVVRPDSLINEAQVSAYQLHASPTRSAIFDPGKTSRINVAHFMAELICDDQMWQKWKGQMPVIYNQP
jgi:nucleoside-diphosphate-sugar epimerase